MENAARIFESLLLMRSRDVAMPMKNGNAGFIAKLGDTEKLVIDEGFKRSYIKCAECSGHIVIELREDGEEGGFRLPDAV